MGFEFTNWVKCAGLGGVMILSACQTTAAPNALYSGIDPNTQAGITRSAQSPICVQFYSNAAVQSAQPAAAGGGIGTGLIKTIGLGILSGVASGGVGALGISSNFVELAMASAANQVVYQGGSAILDGDASTAEASGPSADIVEAASVLGCPVPTESVLAGAVQAVAALGLDNKESEADSSDSGE